jgi:hypothetical protein
LGLKEVRLPEDQTIFPNKDDIKQIETIAALKLKSMFKEASLEKISRILAN